MRRFENNMYDSYTYVRTALNEKRNLLPEKEIDEINRMSEDGGDEDLGLYIKFSAAGTQAVGIKSIDYETWDYEDLQNPVANLEYSLDGKNWNNWETGDPVEFGNGVDLYVRGMNPDGFNKIDTSDEEAWTGRFNRVFFTYNEPTSLSGDIMGLINYKTQVTEIPNDACFKEMFDYDYGEGGEEAGAYDALSDISELTLSATTLKMRCYDLMFAGCTSLTTSLSLPATELADSCYYGMFSGCTSLTIAPELPATELAKFCYYEMFYECTSLTTAPELPATTLAESCYKDMFGSCSSLTTAPELPATTLAESCYANMFQDCTSLTTAPELPATELVGWCYQSMFAGCTSLSTPLELPVTELVDGCYYYMFYGCSSLNSVTCLATDTSAYSCLMNWLSGVSSTGTFTKKTGVEYPEGSIPENWTVNEI